VQGETAESNVDENGPKLWFGFSREAEPSVLKDWPKQHEWLKQTMEKLIAAVSKHLDKETSSQEGSR
jgi:hypothetical protein